VDGRVNLKIPAGTLSGQRFRLKGRGPAIPGTRDHADQFVIVVIAPPRKVTPEVRELLEELQKLSGEELRSDLPEGV
jgi:molecular chaperone DnaJ